jgi:GcrA cell cycle regulator
MRGDMWTNDKIELLKQLWAGGATAQSIAARLGGISRSAVLGKVFRLRLGTPAGGASSAIQGKSAAPKARVKPPGAAPPAASDAAISASSLSLARRRRRRRQDQSRTRATAGKRGKSLLELTNDSCRWPHGQPGTATFFFCGAAGADLEGGMPYCIRHARRAYLTEPVVAEKPKRPWRPISSPPLVPDQVKNRDDRVDRSFHA